MPDFGHFISLDRMNSVFSHLINAKNSFFHFLAASFCLKNLAFARKIMVLPESRGLQPLRPPGSYACVYKTKIKDVDELWECVVDEWDKLDQRVIDEVVGELWKRLRRWRTVSTRCI